MKQLRFSIKINAPKAQVWNTMLEDKTYREWTAVFTEGSHYIGSWEKGEKIKFMDPKGGGMVSVIAENKPYEFISIKHLGYINNGVEDTESADIKAWAPAFENYTFSEENGETTLVVDQDITEEYEKMFLDLWPKALKKLKEICER